MERLDVRYTMISLSCQYGRVTWFVWVPVEADGRPRVSPDLFSRMLASIGVPDDRGLTFSY